MPRGGELRITAQENGGAAVVVRVQDTGPGLSDNAWATLFQPFASSGKKNGLGLGLAFSRQTMLDHGGDIWAERNASRGAVFCLQLPLAPAPAPVAEAPVA